MRQKRLVTLFYFNDNIAGKDMFLVPKYLSEALGMVCEFVFPKWKENEHLRGEYRGVKLTAIKSKSRFHSTFWTEKAMLWWLICHARRIDVLSLFWLSPRNLAFAKIYKWLNPKGICYIKGDINEASILALSPTKTKSWKQKISNWLAKSVDIVSVETSLAQERLKEGVMGANIARAVTYLPNAFDDQLCQELRVEAKPFDQKENLIITVGRIGHKEKNNEMLLNALYGISMKDWKVWFVGPIEDNFRIAYQQFIDQNPDKQHNVCLYGAINDKRILWEVYNSAKIFVLTSPKEGFPNVFPEALHFGNYIISTNVSSTTDISNNGKLASVIPVGDTAALQKELQRVFDNKIDLTDLYPKIIDHGNKFKWSEAIKPLAQRIKDIQDEKSN